MTPKITFLESDRPDQDSPSKPMRLRPAQQLFSGQFAASPPCRRTCSVAAPSALDGTAAIKRRDHTTRSRSDAVKNLYAGKVTFVGGSLGEKMMYAMERSSSQFGSTHRRGKFGYAHCRRLCGRAPDEHAYGAQPIDGRNRGCAVGIGRAKPLRPAG